MTPISMIDVAQHFTAYIDLVVERGERFTLLREGKPVAELGPVLQVVRLEDLPTLLASLPCLTPAAADAITGDCEVSDPLLDEVEEAQRKLEAEFDNDPAKLLVHYEEVQKRNTDRLVSRHMAGRVAKHAHAEAASEAETGNSAA